MMGLYFLALVCGYIWIASKIRKRVRPYWGKVLVVVIAVLVPTADAIYGRIKFQLICKAESGLHIYRIVEGVDGFGFIEEKPYEKWLIMGFKYVEGIDRSGKSSRMTLREDGTVTLENGVEPISQYVYGRSRIGNPWNRWEGTHSGTENYIQVRDTGEILSRNVSISFKGGWFERFAGGPISGPSGESFATCGSNISIDKLVTKTLKPIQPNSNQPNSTQ